ncbi:hypothetical protein Tco_0097978 [Tanacetum coccineum]
MAVLESCPRYNKVAYLEKTEGNAEFHEVIDFLARSSIHHALTISLVVSTTFVEQFWMSAKSKIINNVRYITAKVAGKPVSISEAPIRSDLLFDDADGIDSLPNQAIFDAIQLMGYEGDLTVLTFNKALFSPQWRFLFHTMNHCISSKSTSWDQIPTNIATAVICLTSNQKYNFSKLIFDGMLRHLDAKKKFVMYPRFISIFLDKQLVNVPVPLDHFPVNALTSKVFSFMVKKGKHFSGKVTPLFASMLVQSTEDEGATSERPSEPQPTPSPPHPSEANVEPQSDPSPRPSPTPHIPDSIPEVSGGNQGGQSSSDRSLSGTEGGMTLQSVYDLCISLCTQVTDQAKEIKHLKAQIKKLKKQAKPETVSKQGRKFAKAEPSVHKDPLFDELDDDEIDNMDTEDAQDVGRTRDGMNAEKEGTEDAVSTKDVVCTDKEKVSIDRSKVSTDRSNDSTDKEKEGTDKDKDSTVSLDEGTDDRTEARRAKAKAVSREKEKGVELKDVEETERPRPTSTRSLLTLKPLPKIDPKDKGKKKIKEEDESDTESEDIPKAEKKFKQLARDEEIARKRFLAEQRAIAIRNKPPTRTQLRNQMINYLKHVESRIPLRPVRTKLLKIYKLLYGKVEEVDEVSFAVGSTKDERRIKEMNEGVKDTDQKRLKEEDIEKVPAKVEVTEQGEINVEESVIARLDKGIITRWRGTMLVILQSQWNFRAFKLLMEVLHIFDRQDLFHLYELIMEQYSEITLEGFELILWGDLKIMMESSTKENDQSDFWSNQQDWKIITWRLYEACGVCILELEDGIVIHMVFNSPCFMVKSWLVQDQTVLGKDYSNLLIADSLLKTIWFINAPCYGNEALASPKANELTIPEQTATGKGTSNPFMAGSLPKTTKPTYLPQQFDCCEICGGPHYSYDCQAGNAPVYDQVLYYNQNFSDDKTPFYSLDQQQQFDCCEDLDFESDFMRSHRDTNRILEELLRTLKTNSPVGELEGSNNFMEVPFDNEQILRQHNTAHVTPPPLAYTPTPPILATIEPLDTLLMGDEVINTTLARENDEFIKFSVDDFVPIPREFKVTSISIDLECGMPINTPPSPYLVILGDEKTNLLLRDDLDTHLMGDREIDFNPCRDIKELECLLANDPIPVPRVFDEPLGNSDSISRPIKTSNLILEELTTEIGLDDSISTDIDDRYYDSEGDILYFE